MVFRSSNNNTGFTPGASSISLRGFYPSATLVLIDGRRAAPFPVGQAGTFSFIDLNSIPRAAIESIEGLEGRCFKHLRSGTCDGGGGRLR